MADGIDLDVSAIRNLELGLIAATAEAPVLAGKVVNAGILRVVGWAKANQRYVDTGATRDSIFASGPGGSALTETSLEAEAGPTTSYAPFIHDGTSKIDGFPFMDLGLEHETPSILEAAAQIPGRLLR